MRTHPRHRPAPARHSSPVVHAAPPVVASHAAARAAPSHNSGVMLLVGRAGAARAGGRELVAAARGEPAAPGDHGVGGMKRAMAARRWCSRWGCALARRRARTRLSVTCSPWAAERCVRLSGRWQPSPVTVTWHVDPVPVTTTGCASQTYTDVTASCHAPLTWAPSGTASISFPLNVEISTPDGHGHPGPPPDANGWYNHPVTVTPRRHRVLGHRLVHAAPRRTAARPPPPPRSPAPAPTTPARPPSRASRSATTRLRPASTSPPSPPTAWPA